jgi:hypothetical protein
MASKVENGHDNRVINRQGIKNEPAKKTRRHFERDSPPHGNVACPKWPLLFRLPIASLPNHIKT